MGCGKEIFDVGEDIAATTAGFALGGPAGAAAGAGLASASQGKSITQDLIAAGTAGFGSSADVGQALGLEGSIASGVGNSVSDAIGSVGNSLGLTSGDTTNAVGSTVAPGGQVIAAPATTTAVAPGPGTGGSVPAGSLGDFDANSINNLFSQGLSDGKDLTALTPGNAANAADSLGVAGGVATQGPLNATGAAANSALGEAGTDAIGSTTDSLGVPGGFASGAAPASASPAASSSFINSLESAAGKAVIPAAGLAFEAAQGPQKLPGQASALEAGGAATAPLLGLETAGANEASSGQLTATQQANIEQGVQQQQNQLIQQLASQGISNPTQSSQYQQGIQQIQQWALAQQQNYITQAINEATSAGGAASNNIASVANEQVQLDTGYQNALAAAFGALGGGLTVKA